MTLKERIIVETYTGYVMTNGFERPEVYKYMEDLLGRPVWTHELGGRELREKLQKLSQPDFIALCRGESR